MEVVARQLLLLYISLTNPKIMGLQEKTEFFLEQFGNSEIRHQTEETLKSIAAQLSLSVTDTLSTDTHTHPCLDTSFLKFKERDELARIFKLWQCPPSTPVSVQKAWGARVRQHLGTRYDARKGCFDWDLTMKLHDRGCSVIHKLQYAKWRETGVAFELREGLYQIANQTLLSTRVFRHRGDRVGVRGYWGDIVSSPYLSFGIETENKDLLKTQNNQHLKTAQDISVWNIQALFTSLCNRGHLHTSEPDRSQDSEDNHHFSVKESIEPASETQSEVKQPQSSKSQRTHELDLMNLKDVTVSFLSLDSLAKLPVKSRYSHLFNAIYCSASMVHHLDSSLMQIAAPDALLMVELGKYLLDLSKEQEANFAARVVEIAREAGFKPAYDQDKDAYAVFTLQTE
ncbi:dynein axonemal assembly factor 3-like isoform X2 [Trichomycterus rosablanca]